MTKSCHEYGVATISRLLKITGLFCKRALSKRRCFAKETYNLKEPTNRSHPISVSLVTYQWDTPDYTAANMHLWRKTYHTYERVMSHIWTSHVTHIRESRHTHPTVRQHIHTCEERRTTHMNESCHKYKGVTLHTSDCTPAHTHL